MLSRRAARTARAFFTGIIFDMFQTILYTGDGKLGVRDDVTGVAIISNAHHLTVRPIDQDEVAGRARRLWRVENQNRRAAFQPAYATMPVFKSAVAMKVTAHLACAGGPARCPRHPAGHLRPTAPEAYRSREQRSGGRNFQAGLPPNGRAAERSPRRFGLACGGGRGPGLTPIERAFDCGNAGVEDLGDLDQRVAQDIH